MFEDICKIVPDCPRDVLEHTIQLAVEIAREGREGRKVGTIFVLGDEQTTLQLSKPLILDPLEGHPSELKKVSEYLKPVSIKKDGILCKEGDEGNELFIIESGRAAVKINLQDGTEKEITELASGDFFGEMAIFENEKRFIQKIDRMEKR